MNNIGRYIKRREEHTQGTEGQNASERAANASATRVNAYLERRKHRLRSAERPEEMWASDGRQDTRDETAEPGQDKAATQSTRAERLKTPEAQAAMARVKKMSGWIPGSSAPVHRGNVYFDVTGQAHSEPVESSNRPEEMWAQTALPERPEERDAIQTAIGSVAEWIEGMARKANANTPEAERMAYEYRLQALTDMRAGKSKGLPEGVGGALLAPEPKEPEVVVEGLRMSREAAQHELEALMAGMPASFRSPDIERAYTGRIFALQDALKDPYSVEQYELDEYVRKHPNVKASLGEWAGANAAAGWAQIGGNMMQTLNATVEPLRELFTMGVDKFLDMYGLGENDTYRVALRDMKEKAALGAVYNWAVDPMRRAEEKAESVNQTSGFAGRIGGQVLQNAVRMIPTAILSQMGGGTGGAPVGGSEAMGGFGRAVMESAKEMANSPTFMLSYGEMYGPRYEEAVQGGASPLAATLTATISTLMNAAVEGGGVQDMDIGATGLREWVESALDEGREEIIQTFIDQLAQKAFVESDIPWFSVEDGRAVINPKVLGESALVGALAGGVMSTPSFVTSAISPTNDSPQSEFEGVYQMTPEEIRTLVESERAAPPHASPAQEIALQAAGQLPAVQQRAEIGTQSTRTAPDQRASAASEQSVPVERDQAQLESASAAYGEDAGVFEAHYEGGDVATYRKAFDALYTAGTLGIDIEQARGYAGELVRGMSEAQQTGIYQAGQNKAARTITPGVVRRFTRKMTHAERVKMRILDEIGRKNGYEFDVVESIGGGINSATLPGTRRITVAMDATGGAYVHAAIHEVVHQLKANYAEGYTQLQEVVLKYLQESEGFDLEKAIRARIGEYERTGTAQTRDGALEEIIAEAVPTFLTDKEASRTFFKELASRDRTVVEKIRDAIIEFVENLKKTVEKYVKQMKAAGRERSEIEALMGETEALQEIAATLEWALETEAYISGVSEDTRADAVSDELEQAVENGEPVSGADEVRFSLGRDAEFAQNARELNARTRNVAESVLDEAAEVRGRIHDFMADPANEDALKLPADIEGDTFFSNSSYGGSEESTSVCIRSMAVQALMDEIAKDLGRPLSVEDTILISQEVAAYTDKPECYYCYVAQDRRSIREFLGRYLEERGQALKQYREHGDEDKAKREWLGGRKPTGTTDERWKLWQDAQAAGQELITGRDLASMEELEVEIDKLQARIAKAIGGKVTFAGIQYKKGRGKAQSFENVLKTADAALTADIYHYMQVADALRYAKSASWAKKMTGYAAYNNHILRWTPKRVRDLNSHYGLRMYSFSDFSPAFILENMQMLTDAAVRGLKVLAYTKELDFVRIFAPTGANINISVFATEVNGEIVSDAMMGAPWQEAIELREQYPNVGVTLVATSDAIAEFAEQQPWVDTVIPYHMVRTGTKVAKYFGYKNYTAESSDGKKAGFTFKKGDVTSIPPEMHGNDIVQYVRALEEHHLTPRFADRMKGYQEFLDGIIGEDEFRAMNPYYMKYVNETRRSAAETPFVQPVFDEGAAMSALNTMVREGGYAPPIGGTYENMQDIAEEIAEKIRGGGTDEVYRRIDGEPEARTRFSLGTQALTEDQRITLPVDVDVSVEGIREMAENAMKDGIGDRLNARMETRIGQIASNICKETQSSYRHKDLVAAIRKLVEAYSKGETTETMLDEMAAVCRDVIEKSSKRDESLREQYADVRDMLRRTGISLTETQKQEAANSYGSYDAFRKSVFGSVNLVRDGMSLDALWAQLSEQHPEMFPADTGEAEMVGRLADFAELMKPRYVNPYGMDADAAAYDLAIRIQGDVVGMIGARNAAQQLYGSAKKLQAHYKQQYDEALREKRKARVDKFQQIASDLQAAKEAGDQKKVNQVMGRYRYALRTVGLQDAYAEAQAVRKARDLNREKNRKRREIIGRIEKKASELMRMMTRPEKGKRVPTVLQDTVLKVLEALDFAVFKEERGLSIVTAGNEHTARPVSGNPALSRRSETKRSQAWKDHLADLRNIYEKIWEKQNTGETPEGLDGLMMTFSERNLGDIREAVEQLSNWGAFRLSAMNSAQLKNVETLLKTVQHTVNSIGKLWKIQRYQNVAELGEASISEMNERRKRFFKEGQAGAVVRDFLALDMMEPISYGERLGEGGSAIIQGLMEGEREKFAKVREAAEATERMMKDAKISGYTIGKWRKHAETYRISGERAVRMTDVQLMNLYLTAKRPQGMQHLLANGITIPESKEAGVQEKNIYLSRWDIYTLTDKLTEEQKKIADAMQEYLSTTVAKWGNDVTQRLYLYDAFTEQHYWPLSSDPNSVMTREPEQDRAFNAIVNAGFTKPVNAKASNALLMMDAFEVFGKHIADMASYAGYAEVITDTMAWINYRQRTEIDGVMRQTGSVKGSIEKLLGSGGLKYLTRLVQDINGARRGGDGMQFTSKLMGNAKRAAVMGKLRVAIQQPTSIVRAAAEINPLYFAARPHKGTVREMQKWSSLAWWKSHGNFEIGTGKGMDSILWGDTRRTDTALEVAGKAAALGLDPGLMDDLAWGAMWNAVKQEINSTRKELERGSDEYFRAVAERFDYIMDRTQVVDTVMHRAQIMRSTDGLVKNMTAFMSEPTKTYNMAMRAVMDFGRNPGKRTTGKLVRTALVYAASAAATAAVVALHDAIKYRDDEEETLDYLLQGGFAEDWAQQFMKSFLSNVNPLENLVLAQDVVEIVKGGDVPTYMALEGIKDIVTAFETVQNYLSEDNSKKKTVYGAAKPVLTAIGNVFGLPINGALASAETLGRILDPKWMQTKSSMYTAKLTHEALYEAIVSGDKKKEQSIRAQLREGMYGSAPKSKEEISIGISDVLATADERVLRAYWLRNQGNQATALVALRKEIQAAGFTEAEVNRAINTVEGKYQALYRAALEEAGLLVGNDPETKKRREEKLAEAEAIRAKGEQYGIPFEEPEAKDLDEELEAKAYKYEHLFAAVRNGGAGDVGIVAEAMEAESDAEDPEEAVRNQVSGEFREEYVSYVLAGRDREARELARNLAVVGIDEEDLDRWVKDARVDTLVSAFDSGSTTQINATVRALRN